MAGRGVTCTVLILVIIALAACSSPVGMGSIGGSITSSTIYEGLEVALTPSSRTYKVGDLLQQSHLLVSARYRGERQTVPLAECDVFIENPDRSLTPVPASGYELKTEGTITILVEWAKYSLQGRRSIEVQPSGGGGGGGGDGGTEAPAGIIIKWEDDP